MANRCKYMHNVFSRHKWGKPLLRIVIISQPWLALDFIENILVSSTIRRRRDGMNKFLQELIVYFHLQHWDLHQTWPNYDLMLICRESRFVLWPMNKNKRCLKRGFVALMTDRHWNWNTIRSWSMLSQNYIENPTKFKYALIGSQCTCLPQQQQKKPFNRIVNSKLSLENG